MPECTKLLNEVPPEFNVCVADDVKVTVFAPGAKVPPDCNQLPATLNVPDGAVSVPLLRIIFPEVTLPVDPVKVPPATVRSPLNVCVAVDPK